MRIRPHRLDVEAQRGALQQPPGDDGSEQRQEEAQVQLGALHPWEGGIPVNDRGDRVAASGHLERRRGEQPGEDAAGDVVEHDGDDDLVGSSTGLEGPGDPTPEGTCHESGKDGEQQVWHQRQPVEVESHPGRHRRPGDGLALTTDVEQAGLEAQSDGKAGADERCGLGGRRRDGLPRAERPLEQGGVGGGDLVPGVSQRVGAGEQVVPFPVDLGVGEHHDDRRDDEGQHECCHRHPEIVPGESPSWRWFDASLPSC